MLIELKKWALEDLESLVHFANNKKVSDNLADGFPHPYTSEHGRLFIERASHEEPIRIFAICADNQVIGSIGIFPDTDIHRKNAAIAYWLAEPFWGKGIVPNAIALMVTYGFETFDIDRIYAKPFSKNKASHRVLEKAGFKLEAVLEKTIVKNGEVLDELIYGIRKRTL